MSVVPASPSLEICAIGLGQGGGNLAAEWFRRGHRALFINTTSSDFRALGRNVAVELPRDAMLEIGLPGPGGAGKDPEYGRECVLAHRGQILEAVRQQLGSPDVLVVAAGLGGGTGSACAALLEVLETLELPTLVIATLPSAGESGLVKVNAVRALDGIVQAHAHARVFIDNQRLVDQYPQLDLLQFFPEVNRLVLAGFDELNRLNSREDLWGIRSFDAADLQRVLLSGGVLQFDMQTIEDDGALTAEGLIARVTDCVNGGAHLAAGSSLTDIVALGLVVVGPESRLRTTSMQVFADAHRLLQEKSGGAAVYDGLYVGGDDELLRVYCLTVTQVLPERVNRLLDEAKEQATELARKAQQKLPTLEIASLPGLKLPSRGGRRAEEPPAVAGRENEAQAGGPDPDDSDGATPAITASETSSTASAPSAPAPSAPAVPRESADELAGTKPRVGTGRYDEAELRTLEPTAIVSGLLDLSEDVVAATQRVAEAAGGHDALAPLMSEEDDPLFQDEPRSPADAFELAARPALTVIPARPEGAIPGRGNDVDAEMDLSLLGGVPAQPVMLTMDAEPVFSSAYEPGEPAVSPPRVPGPEPRGEITRTDIRLSSVLPSVGNAADLSSIVDTGSHELQHAYEDLVDRYRQAADRRRKESIARRLIDDASADDLETRALAVWAMAALSDQAFHTALVQAAADENPDIMRLAMEGLARL